MGIWNVEIELAVGSSLVQRDLSGVAEDVIDVLLDNSPAVSVSPVGLLVRLSVEGSDHLAAMSTATDLTLLALEKATDDVFSVVSARAIDEARSEAELEEPNFPQLLGVHELAEHLGVSRQRASQLGQSPTFPTPIVRLGSGPIWLEAAVLRYVASWQRRPGRRNSKLPVV
jgi:hypothetical protein